MTQEINPTYVTQDQAIWLNKKKFDVPCEMCLGAGDLPVDKTPLPFNAGDKIKHVNSKHQYYSAPEQHVVVEWLRVNHGIWVFLMKSYGKNGKFLYCIDNSEDLKLTESNYSFNSPQEAYSAAFDYIKDNGLIG